MGPTLEISAGKPSRCPISRIICSDYVSLPRPNRQGSYFELKIYIKCVSVSEPSMLDNAISTIITCAYSYSLVISLRSVTEKY